MELCPLFKKQLIILRPGTGSWQWACSYVHCLKNSSSLSKKQLITMRPGTGSYLWACSYVHCLKNSSSPWDQEQALNCGHVHMSTVWKTAHPHETRNRLLTVGMFICPLSKNSSSPWDQEQALDNGHKITSIVQKTAHRHENRNRLLTVGMKLCPLSKKQLITMRPGTGSWQWACSYVHCLKNSSSLWD